MAEIRAEYDKTEMNSFVIDLYDKKMQEGKHGHYETMFHVVHQAIKRVAPPQQQAALAQRPWVSLTEGERVDILDAELTTQHTEHFALCQAIEAKLKEKNT